ncbi:MAG TPA: hypothetical protein VIQ76_07855, partial [Propionibacteriaceae bacterium]
VDRTSRFVQLVHLPRRHSAAAVRAALTAAFQLLPPSVRLTLTWDQGSEMAQHDQLAELFRDGVYFAAAPSTTRSPPARRNRCRPSGGRTCYALAATPRRSPDNRPPSRVCWPRS